MEKRVLDWGSRCSSSSFCCPSSSLHNNCQHSFAELVSDCTIKPALLRIERGTVATPRCKAEREARKPSLLQRLRALVSVCLCSQQRMQAHVVSEIQATIALRWRSTKVSSLNGRKGRRKGERRSCFFSTVGSLVFKTVLSFVSLPANRRRYYTSCFPEKREPGSREPRARRCETIEHRGFVQDFCNDSSSLPYSHLVRRMSNTPDAPPHQQSTLAHATGGGGFSLPRATVRRALLIPAPPHSFRRARSR